MGDRELDMNNVSKNIEVKKEELVSKIDKKISEYMTINLIFPPCSTSLLETEKKLARVLMIQAP